MRVFPMKNVIYCFLVVMICCENRGKIDEEFPDPIEDGEGWISYEGRVPLSENSSLYIEVSMRPSNSIGEGTYRLNEFVEGEHAGLYASSITGNYSTLLGETPEERIVQFHNSARSEGIKRTYKAPGFIGNITDSHLSMIHEERFRTTDLTLKVHGRNKLIVLDDALQVVSIEPEDNLVRRTSRLFTVEGRFRHNGFSADFREINTGETWIVSKYGDYSTAIRQYHQLTTRKFEFTYMKAIGFSIRDTVSKGKEREALVIRKVLQMTTIANAN